jgi:hypothetical protein
MGHHIPRHTALPFCFGVGPCRDGVSTSSGRHVLSSSRNDFERGATDRFSLRLPDLGELQRLVVGHDNRGAAAPWHLAMVSSGWPALLSALNARPWMPQLPAFYPLAGRGAVCGDGQENDVLLQWLAVPGRPSLQDERGAAARGRGRGRQRRQRLEARQVQRWAGGSASLTSGCGQVSQVHRARH